MCNILLTKHMNLAELITTLNLPFQPAGRWAIVGPEAGAFHARLNAEEDRPPVIAANLSCAQQLITQLDGLLLAGALSQAEPAQTQTRLEQTAVPLKTGATLVAVDWQADGPLDTGPDLGLRFKQGRLRRLLREIGFGLIETLADRPHYYIVRAVKGDPPPYPAEFVDVAALAELPRNGMKQVELFGRAIVIANTGREIVAFDRACPHAGSPLDKGLLRRRNLACPKHGYIWDVITGRPVEPDDEDILQRYTTRIDPDRQRILVSLTPADDQS